MKLRITDAAIAAGYESQQCATSPVVRTILEAAAPHIEVEESEPNGPPLTFVYRNWRGEIATRKAVPLRLEFASTEWHPEAQWLLIAWDIEKRATRSFAIKDINPAPEHRPDVEGSPLLEWAVSKWSAEVKNRPLVNVHRRSLDDAWRQVIRWAGGDPAELVGPSHDELIAAAPTRDCPTCGGTGHEARHSICRDCDEAFADPRPDAEAVVVTELQKARSEYMLTDQELARRIIAAVARKEG
ncbi:hypothetical protein [Ensifer sp. LCM 4579]|uniref:hypothetical protein n=1 Tax=Ensifer sp. LCM 4579 TaxID=1848292 RepID=UPI0008DA4F43|nr:hypothetical protein [Ensifer sp. LCM 4579]OHV73363.1 hypothetical protein LCM4579_10605 [Ensifer sp. LCM 4579]